MGLALVSALNRFDASSENAFIASFTLFGLGLIAMVTSTLVDFTLTNSWHSTEVDLKNGEMKMIEGITNFEDSPDVRNDAKAAAMLKEHLNKSNTLFNETKMALGRKNRSNNFLLALQISSYLAFIIGAIFLFDAVQ